MYILERVYEIISVPCKIKPSIFQDKAVKKELESLQQKYIITSTDKAANNIHFTCKKLYYEILDKELLSSSTYEHCTDDEDNIVNSFIKELHQSTGISVEHTQKVLPTMYWLPKQHKQPVKQRFIASGRRACTKKLSQLLTSALKRIIKTLSSHYKFKFKYKTGNPVWILDDRSPILDKIKLLNIKGSAYNINTFDFSTLYTSIPHNELFHAISELCKEAFSISGKSLLHVSHFNSYWCGNDKHSNLEKSYCLTLDKLLEWIKLLLDNIFVKYNGKIFKQVIGIPMGTDCAPLLANLFLFFYEKNFINQLDEIGDTDTLLKLSNIGRFIDDLITLNDHSMLNELLALIYPECMVINKTNVHNKSATYLDMDINIVGNKAVTKVFDKRKEFNFKVRSLTHFNSNISMNTKLGVVMGQLIRFMTINSDFDLFIDECKCLFEKLLYLDYPRILLKKSLKGFLNRYSLSSMVKYWKPIAVNMIIS